MLRTIENKNNEGVLAACSIPPVHQRTTDNGVSLLNPDAINVYMNMPCPLKVVTRVSLENFVNAYNQSHAVPIYSPMLLDGNTKNIESELKSAVSEDEIPEIILASGLHTVFSKSFKTRFIDTGIYQPVIPTEMLKRMSSKYQKLVTEHNVGIIGTGFWSIVFDLSYSSDRKLPAKWTDLTLPDFRGLLSVHGYHGKASIAALLQLLKEWHGNEAIQALGMNIRNIWHFAEILKRLDTQEPRRTPFNLLPNAATVQVPVKKRAAILEFNEGPVLAPMLMYVKASKAEACKQVIDFFLGEIMRQNLRKGDFYLADEFDWNSKFCFPDWHYLLENDYEQLASQLDTELKKGLAKDVFEL